jgi:hypothetical protein
VKFNHIGLAGNAQPVRNKAQPSRRPDIPAAFAPPFMHLVMHTPALGSEQVFVPDSL